MAEIEIPNPKASTLTRERSSLDALSKSPAQKPKKDIPTGIAVMKKETLSEKLKDAFNPNDLREIGSYVFYDVFVPDARRLLYNLVVGAAGMLILGTRTNPGAISTQTRGAVRTNYSGASRARSVLQSQGRETRPLMGQAIERRRNFRLDSVVIKDFDFAKEILESLISDISDGQRPSVDDYFNMVGLTADYTARKWGWSEIDPTTAIIATVDDDGNPGWYIDLPEPVVIR